MKINWARAYERKIELVMIGWTDRSVVVDGEQKVILIPPSRDYENAVPFSTLAILPEREFDFLRGRYEH